VARDLEEIRRRDRERHREKYSNDAEYRRRKLEYKRERYAQLGYEYREREIQRQVQRNRDKRANDPEYLQRKRDYERVYKRVRRARQRLEQLRALGLDVDRVARRDTRSRQEKLEVMAAQTASPFEAEIARRLLARERLNATAA
jgi:hypothetical protein